MNKLTDNMKIIYILLLNFSISAAEYIELEDLNDPSESILTLNNLPHDIKMLIAEKVDIKDIPNLTQTTPELHRFFNTNFNQKYLDLKEATKIKVISYAQLRSDLDSPYKVVKLLNLLNRLYKYKYDMSAVSVETIALESSKLRFAPAFLILGGRTALKDFCSNYDVNIAYAPKFKSLLKSIRYDYSILPIFFIGAYVITCIFLLPYLIHEYSLAKERYSHLPEYNSSTLSNYYTQNEIDVITRCTSRSASYLKTIYTDGRIIYGSLVAIDPNVLSLIQELDDKYDPNNTLSRYSIPLVDILRDTNSSNFLKVYAYNYPNYIYYYSNAKEALYGVSKISKSCLNYDHIILGLYLPSIIYNIALIFLLADKMYIACKKKNRANLTIQEI